MVDELEDTSPAQRAILAALREDNSNQLYALDAGDDEEGVSEWVLGFSPGGGAALEEPEGEKQDAAPTRTPPPHRLWLRSS